MKARKNVHRGSSMIYLGLSAITFLVTYGVAFYLIAIILGQFYSQLNQTPITDPGWSQMSTDIQTTIQYIIPLAAAVGLFIFVLKVLMSSSTRGRD